MLCVSMRVLNEWTGFSLHGCKTRKDLQKLLKLLHIVSARVLFANTKYFIICSDENASNKINGSLWKILSLWPQELGFCLETNQKEEYNS